MQRRHFLAASALPLWGCSHPDDIAGGFSGVNAQRGHLLRDAHPAWPAPSVTHRTEVLIAGGGVAGLAAARALRLRGRDDFALLELEDEAGGNSRATTVNGLACPLGAHYLPLPSDDAPEVQDLLEELGLRTRRVGRWEYDERHLCHSPQERLFFQGAWQPGLLPVQGVGASTLAQYAQFSALVEQVRHAARWTIPASNRPLATVQQAAVAITFVAYLDANGLTDVHLRWYLDYCCRDDYGAGIGTVSAWAGLHYFASRHGFSAPGHESTEREGLLTGRVVLRIANVKQGVEVDALNTASGQVERWQARRAIVALPIFVAARVVQEAPDWLRQAARSTVYAPWLVANLHLKTPLQDRPGAAPSWDNVLYGTQGLGYVDAQHQSLQRVPGATVLTHYRALGDVAGRGGAAGSVAGRRLLMERPWAAWRDQILQELSSAHPDLAAQVTRMDITRYGHAMAVPVPKITSQMGLQGTQGKRNQLSNSERFALTHGHLSFAHSDWAGYSVFEEAVTLGHLAGG
jgi:predicted NAD/FAD-dependent oxidoreductase